MATDSMTAKIIPNDGNPDDVHGARAPQRSPDGARDNDDENREIVRPEDPAFERHYRIGELAQLWQLGRETVRLLVKDERGVIKIRLGRQKAHTIYSVPESVAVRIHTRLLNSR
jgi:hypothetical protein